MGRGCGGQSRSYGSVRIGRSPGCGLRRHRSCAGACERGPQPLAPVPAPPPVGALAFAPGPELRHAWAAAPCAEPAALVLSRDGGLAAAGCEDGRIRLFIVATGVATS